MAIEMEIPMTLQSLLSDLSNQMLELNHTITSSVATGFESYNGRPWVYVALVLLGIWSFNLVRTKPSKYPTVNYDGKAWTYWQAKKSYMVEAKKLLAEGSKKACSGSLTVRRSR